MAARWLLPSVLKRPRPPRRGGFLGPEHLAPFSQRLVDTEPLYSKMVGGDPDIEYRVGMPKFYDPFVAALGDNYQVDLGCGVRVMREAAGGISVMCTFPPGVKSVHELDDGVIHDIPAGWWLDDGSLAPGVPGGPPLPLFAETPSAPTT